MKIILTNTVCTNKFKPMKLYKVIIFLLSLTFYGCKIPSNSFSEDFVILQIDLPVVIHGNDPSKNYCSGALGEEFLISWKIGPDFTKNFSEPPLIVFSDNNVLSLISLDLESQSGYVRIIGKGSSNITIKGEGFNTCSTIPVKVF